MQEKLMISYIKRVLIAGLLILMMVGVGTSINDAVPDYISKWKLDNSSGTFVIDDNTTSANMGTLTGMNVGIDNGTSGWNTSCKYSRCISFDHINDEIIFGNNQSLRLSSELTYMAWFRTNTTLLNKGIMGKSVSATNGTGLFLRSSSPYLRFAISNNGTNYNVDTTTNVHDNTFHHVAATFDGYKMVLYLDGINVSANYAYSGQLINTTGNSIFKIGQTDLLNAKFQGILDDVRVYGRALTNDEINLSMNDSIYINTLDGLNLTLSGSSKNFSSIRYNNNELFTSTILNNLYVNDFAIGTGFIKPTVNDSNILNNILYINSSTTNLLLNTTYINYSNYIQVDVDLKDISNTDRAIQIAFDLPINTTGWNWWNYPRESNVIITGNNYDTTYTFSGRSQSWYPFSLVENSNQGLTLAVPMNVPRVYRLSANTSNGTRIEFDIGLSNLTTAIGASRANITFIIYKSNNLNWSFRDTINKYYSIYPDFFSKNTTYPDGAWVHPHDLNRSILYNNIASPEDFGYSYNEIISIYSTQGRFHQFWSQQNNISNTVYIEPWGWWKGGFSCVLSDTQKRNYLTSFADPLNETYNSTYWGTSMVLTPTIANAIIGSSVNDSTGVYFIDSSDSFCGSQGQNFFANSNPNLSKPNIYDTTYTGIIIDSITNASLTNAITNWTYGANTTWNNTDSHSGTYSARIYNPTTRISGRWYSEYIPIESSTEYNFSAWLKNGTNATGNKITVSLVETRADDTSTATTELISTNADWTYKSTVFTTDSDAVNVYLYIEIYNGAGSGLVDDISIIKTGSSTNIVQTPGFESAQSWIFNIDGVSVDSMLSSSLWGIINNYNTSQYQYETIPLIFNYTDSKPVIYGAFSQYEYLRNISERMHDQGKYVTTNIFPKAYSFYALYSDVSGGEFNEASLNDEWLINQRILMKNKSISNLFSYEHADQIPQSYILNFLQRSTFYGVYPSIDDSSNTEMYLENLTLVNRDRSLFKKYIPIIKNISSAGWEPIQYVTSNNSNIWIERYGQNISNLHFAVRNENALSQSGRIMSNLTKDFGASLYQVYNITDMVNGGTLSQEINQSTVSINGTLSIGTNDTLVFKVQVLNFTITPSSDSIFVNVTNWNSTYKKWKSNVSVTTQHIIGDLSPSTGYQIKRNGFNYATVTSNSTGWINWNYTGGFNEHQFELENFTSCSVSPGENIQTAINACSPGTILLEPGEHDIVNYTINVTNNTWIIGNSSNRSAVHVHYSINDTYLNNSALMQLCSAPYNPGGGDYGVCRVGFYSSNNSNVSLRNFTLHNGDTGNSEGANAGIYWFNVNNSTIRNVEVYGAGQYGILTENRIMDSFKAWGTNNYNSLNDSYIHGSYTGASLNSFDNSVIYNNTFKSAGTYALMFQNSRYSNLSNNIMNHSAHGGIQLYSGSNNNIIQNNTIYGNVRSGITMMGGDNNVIRYNNLTGNSYDPGAQYWGGITFENPYSSTNNTIENNLINGGAVGIGRAIGDGVTNANRVGNVNYIYSNTLVNVRTGIYLDDTDNIYYAKNNIIVNTTNALNNSNAGTASLDSRYNNIYNSSANYTGTVANKTGDIFSDPLFVSSIDFHLKSQAGHWNGSAWVNDTVTSPAIDAGDPNSDYSNEPAPSGSRINMGIYGNTAYASKTYTESVFSTYSISGYVFDNINSPITSATIFNNTNTTTSSGTGYYQITGMTNGSYNFTYNKTGFTDGYQTIIISGSNLQNQNKTIWDNSSPAQVTGLTNEAVGTTTINLSWTSISDASHYRVYRNNSLLGTTTNNYYNDTGLTASTYYSYMVGANDSYNNSGLNSSTLNVTTSAISSTYTLSGFTTVSGIGLAGVNVSNSAIGFNISNSMGYYSISGFTNGSHIISSSLSGYDTNITSVTVSGNTTQNFTLTVSPAPTATPSQSSGGSGGDAPAPKQNSTWITTIEIEGGDYYVKVNGANVHGVQGMGLYFNTPTFGTYTISLTQSSEYSPVLPKAITYYTITVPEGTPFDLTPQSIIEIHSEQEITIHQLQNGEWMELPTEYTGNGIYRATISRMGTFATTAGRSGMTLGSIAQDSKNTTMNFDIDLTPISDLIPATKGYEAEALIGTVATAGIAGYAVTRTTRKPKIKKWAWRR